VASAISPAMSHHSRWPTVARIVLAGPIAALLSVMIVAGMPLWFPSGAAGIDHIVLPLILLPAIWAALFFYAVLDRSLVRVALVALVIGASHLVMLASHFSAPRATSTSQDTKR
jgi:hypothetical protein